MKLDHGQEFEVRPYRPGDEKKILELHRTVFQEEESEQYWNWLFRSNPAGNAWVWLAWDGSDLVGHYAIIPERISVGGAETLGAQSLDTMTHPAYQRRGVFVSLARKAYSEAEAGGCKVMYGLPNELSCPGLVGKLDWREAFTLPRFVKLLRPSAGLSGRWRFALASAAKSRGDAHLRRLSENRHGWSMEEVTELPADYGEFADTCVERGRLSIFHDVSFVRWRFLDCPDAGYRLFLACRDEKTAGCAALRLIDQDERRVGFVALLEGDPSQPECFERLATGVQEACVAGDAGSIVYAGNRSDLVYRSLRRVGFIRRPSALRITIRTSGSFRASLDPLSADDWSMDLGDTDYV